MYRIKTKLTVKRKDGSIYHMTRPTKYAGYALKKDLENEPSVEEVTIETLPRTILKRDGL